MDVKDATEGIRDALNVHRVFGEPYEKNGVTVIPAAKFQGGGGGGGGEGPDKSKGFGSGFGLNARPAGAYVIKEGAVSWQPALDLNRIILMGQIMGIVALLTLRAAVKARAKTRRAEARHSR
jgi:uncharacterized spore protein YtfJ